MTPLSHFQPCRRSCQKRFIFFSSLVLAEGQGLSVPHLLRTSRRPGSFGTTFASNGVKPRDSNGSEASKIMKPVQLKPVQTKPCVEQSSQKVKFGKLSPSPQVKFDISEKPGPKELSVLSNGKVDFHKTQNFAVNGVSKDSIIMEKNEKDMLSLMNRNGFDKSRKFDTLGSGNGRSFALANGSSTKSDSFVANDTRTMAVGGEVDTSLLDASDNSGRKKNPENSCDISVPKRKLEDSCDISEKRKSEDSCNFTGPKRKFETSFDILGQKCKSRDSCDNGCPMIKPKDSSVNSGPNRKWKDTRDYSGINKIEDSCDFSIPMGKSCILLSRDAQSHAEIENMKEMLKNKASSVLRSCGWYNDVYNFMYFRKQSCALEIGSTQSGIDLEKKLIVDAKPTFIRHIPESLKEELIKRLQSFTQKKTRISGSLISLAVL